jgi:hypothetical protein
MLVLNSIDVNAHNVFFLSWINNHYPLLDISRSMRCLDLNRFKCFILALNGFRLFLVSGNPVSMQKRDLTRNTLINCKFEANESDETSRADRIISPLSSPHLLEVIHLFIAYMSCPIIPNS